MSPRRSQLADYETEIQAWRSQGLGFRRITTRLLEEFGLSISHNAVYSFLETLSRNAEPQRRFYDDLPEDIRTNLLQQIVNQWTHDSTALELNCSNTPIFERRRVSNDAEFRTMLVLGHQVDSKACQH